MDTIQAIDLMNYPFAHNLVDKWWNGSHEMRLMKDSMFKGKIPFMMCSPDEFVAEMDNVGYEKVCISMPRMYSYRRKELLIDFTLEEIYESL